MSDPFNLSASLSPDEQQSSAYILESDTSRFKEDVIDASQTQPIIVDFWAPWCGPCKTLTPALEKAVTQAGGAVRLVKINVDENQQLASQLQISSIPTIYAFFQGRPVDGFQGAIPESQIKQFVDNLISMSGGASQPGQDLEKILEEAGRLLGQGEGDAASQLYMAALQLDEKNTRALAGLIRAHLAASDVEGAAQLYDALDADMQESADLIEVKTALDLAREGQSGGDIATLMEKVAHNPEDLQARYDLALALYGAGKREAAMEELLHIIRSDRDWNDEAARKQILRYFEAWGGSDPLTIQGRKKLSSVLFA